MQLREAYSLGGAPPDWMKQLCKLEDSRSSGVERAFSHFLPLDQLHGAKPRKASPISDWLSAQTRRTALANHRCQPAASRPMFCTH